MKTITEKIAAVAANPVLWGIVAISCWMAFGSQFTAADSYRLNPEFSFSGYMEIAKASLIWGATAIISTVIFWKTLKKWFFRRTYNK